MIRSSSSLQQKSIDLSSVGGTEGGASLYRYGQEILSSSQSKSSKSTSFLLGGDGAHREFLPQQAFSQEDETVISFLSQMKPSNPQPKSLKVVSGSQFRLTNHKVPTSCDQCDALDRVNKKNKETIRSLKLQLMRMEENFRDLKYSKVSDNNAMEMKSTQDYGDVKEGSTSSLGRKCEYLEEELAKFKKMLSYERTVNEGIRTTLEEDRNNHKIEVTEFNQELERLKALTASLESINAQLQQAKDENDFKLLSYKQQLEKSEQRLSEALAKLNALGNIDATNSVDNAKELEKLKKEIEKLESANKAHQFTIGQKNSTISQLEDKIQELSSSVSTLESDKNRLTIDFTAQSDLLKSSQEQLQAAKKRCDVLESTVKITIQERDAAKTALIERETEIINKNKKLEHQEVEIKSLNERINDLLLKMSVDGDNSRRALEKAITSSVRLCVVAPTVNVHVNDAKHKFKSRISEKGLKQFLDAEIFEKYCFLYKQASENAGPNGGNLETWLQKMLAQMQNSIEAHVNSAMDGSSL